MENGTDGASSTTSNQVVYKIGQFDVQVNSKNLLEVSLGGFVDTLNIDQVTKAIEVLYACKNAMLNSMPSEPPSDRDNLRVPIQKAVNDTMTYAEASSGSRRILKEDA